MKNQIISAGSNCHTAHWLKLTGLQPDSYPFDWLLSHSYLGLEYVVENIQGRFEHFLDDLVLDHRGHVVSSHFPRTELFHHRELLSEDAAARASERDKLQRRVARLQAALSSDLVTFVYCFDVRPASLTPQALRQFDASIDKLLDLLPHCRLHVYSLHDGAVSDFPWQGVQGRDRLAVSTYVRDPNVSKTWGSCPAFMQQWAERLPSAVS